MTEKRKVEYFLMRYVPNPVTEEFVNFGLVMVEDSATAGRFADARFTTNWSKVNCLDPQADVAMLESLGREIVKQVVEMRDLGEVKKKMDRLYSNVVEVSEAGGCLTDDPALEIEAMARAYFGGILKERKKRISKRSEIFERMREEFDKARIWPLMEKKIAAADYGYKNDPLKIDCGYANGEFKMFHALAPRGNRGLVKELAFSYPVLAAGFLKRRNKHCRLTAIVDGLDLANEDVQFGKEILDQCGIEVRPIAELPDLAERARVELRA